MPIGNADHVESSSLLRHGLGVDGLGSDADLIADVPRSPDYQRFSRRIWADVDAVSDLKP